MGNKNPYAGMTPDMSSFDAMHAKTMKKINEAYGYIPNRLNIAATGAGAVAGVTNVSRVTATEMAPVLAEAAKSRSAAESSYNQQRAMMDTAYKQQIKQASAEWEAANSINFMDVIGGIASMAPGAGQLFKGINTMFGNNVPADGGGRSNIGSTFSTKEPIKTPILDKGANNTGNPLDFSSGFNLNNRFGFNNLNSYQELDNFNNKKLFPDFNLFPKRKGLSSW